MIVYTKPKNHIFIASQQFKSEKYDSNHAKRKTISRQETRRTANKDGQKDIAVPLNPIKSTLFSPDPISTYLGKRTVAGRNSTISRRCYMRLVPKLKFIETKLRPNVLRILGWMKFVGYLNYFKLTGTIIIIGVTYEIFLSRVFFLQLSTLFIMWYKFNLL